MTRALLLGLALLSPVAASAQTTVVEGTSACPSITHLFADGYARAARKNAAAVEPFLVLYNAEATDQAVTITATPGNGLAPVTLARTVPAGERVVVDLFTAVAARGDANFSVSVKYQTYGAADLKMWSGTTVVAVAHPLTVCKTP